MNHSKGILQLFDEIFNEKNCYDLCRKHKFIQRSSSKLKGAEFIKTMIIPSEGISTDSLKGLCKRIREFNPEADLSAQALCERINSIHSAQLMRALFGQIRQSINSKAIERHSMLATILGRFNSVKIEDSTSITLNEQLSQEYGGTDRGGSVKSQVKINVVHDVMKGTIEEASLHEGKVPDQALARTILNCVEKDDLIIRDLGYFALKGYREIADRGAFFLSRLQPNVKIHKNKEDLDPLDLSKFFKENLFDRFEFDGFLGDEKLPARLIFYRQPKEVVDARLREARKRARRTGRTLSKSKKLCMRFAIFVTNAPKEMLSVEMIGTVYRLRWECELIFKRWKGQLQINYLKGIDKNRIDCLIWSKLCMIMLIGMINGYMANYIERHFCVELSEAKVIDYLLRSSAFFWAVVNNKLEEFIKEMEKDGLRMLVKDKRRRKTMRERIFMREGYYESQSINIQKVA